MDILSQLELQLLDLIAQMQTPALTAFFRVITLLGEYGICSIVLCLVLLALKKTRKTGVSLLIALVSVLSLCNLLLKPLVARVRPYDLAESVELLIEPLSDYSFPSGHTTVLFATATVLAFAYPKMRWAFWLIACLVGFSRLYFYVHFPTDVLAGAALGMFCGSIGLAVTRKLYAKRTAHH